METVEVNDPTMQPARPAGARPPRFGLLILGLFFVSGACGLVYEVVWMRMLTLIFGATAFATSTILASFFTGLALGGAYFGRVIDRGHRPLKVYGLLEAGIGLFAFLMPALLAGVTALYVGLARTLDIGFYGISAVRFVLAFAVLVLPATLMGGTLPVVVKHFARSRERLGRQIGLIYALNTLGAVVGTVAAGFFLILALGVREAAYVAGVLNLLVAAVVLVLDRVTRGDVREEHGPEVPAEGPVAGEPVGVAAPAYGPGAVRLALWAIGVSGFCALGLEVFWTRSLVFFLDNSTHAFTTILTTFLVGIGLGSLLVAAFVDRRARLLAWLGGIEVLIGVSALLAIPLIEHLTPVFQAMAGASLDATLHWRWVGMRFLNTFSVVLVPTVLMGMAFPVAARICTTGLGSVGTSMGNVYAVNTIGGVFGSVLAGFVLIPLVGVQAGIVLMAALHALVGVVLVQVEPGVALRTRIASTGAAVLVVGAGALLYLRGDGATLTSYYEGLETDSVLSYEEGIGATVKVYRDTYGDRIISINGFPVAGEPPEYQDAQKGLAHFPLLLSSVEAPRVGIIGFGAGGTSWSVLQHDVSAVDAVELVPAVPRAAHFFPTVNHGVLDHPRYNLILNDGRNHAMITDTEYDVISVDATSPKMAGNGSLYTRDFYALLDARLSEDGIAVQWIPHHLLSDDEVRMTARSFLDVFPHSSLWFSPLRQNMVLIGTRRPLAIDLQALERKFRNRRVRRDLAAVNMTTARDFLAGFVMGEEALARYVGDVPPNTDNHPILEFRPAMAYFVAELYRLRNMLDFREAREPVLPWVVNLGETEAAADAARNAIRTRYDAVTHSLNGDILRLLDEQDRAIEEYEQALMIDPREKNWLNEVWWVQNRGR